MSEPPLWPLAVEVARAIVEASRLEGDDPIDVAQGGHAPRSRVYAFIALAAEFREVDRPALARLLGWRGSCPLGAISRAAATGNSGLKWFDLDRLNSVRQALGWKDLTLEEGASATLQSGRRRREAFERGRNQASETWAKRRAERLQRRKAWQAGDPPAAEKIENPSRALTVARPHAPAVCESEAIPSRELTLASEYALGGRLVDVTASVCGDPPLERSALSERLTAPASEGRRKSDLKDEAFVAEWFEGNADG